MTGAIMCLLYYGFQSEEIRLVKRKDVDVDTRTVCGKYINHDMHGRSSVRLKTRPHISKTTQGGNLGS